MRTSLGPWIVGIIISFIAFVFVFSGLFTPGKSGQLIGGSMAASVNGDAITVAEFNRELNRRMQFYRGMNLTEEQMKAFQIKEGVLRDMINQRLMVQEAIRVGVVPSDEEIRTRIKEIPDFHVEGKFDFNRYNELLKANDLSVSTFEQDMKKRFTVGHWDDYFKSRIHVSSQEVRQEFLVSETKRIFKYVLISPEVMRKQVSVPATEVQAFLKDEPKLNLAKARFEELKTTQYKGKTFDQVKQEVARDVIVTSTKSAEVDKLSQNLAARFIKEGATAASVKAHGLELKTSPEVSRKNPYIPGLGPSDELMKDAFAAKSPIDPAQGGKAKAYTLARGVVVAWVDKKIEADPSKLAGPASEETTRIRGELLQAKSNELRGEWIKALNKRASIKINPSVVDSADGRHIPVEVPPPLDG
ncbi:MAG: SurA N-terminal domain-containing protein [Bacteriovoracia bacterium]